MKPTIPQLVGVVAGLLLLAWGVHRLVAPPGCEGARMGPDDLCKTSTRARIYTQTYDERKNALHRWGLVMVVGGPALSAGCLAGMVVTSRRRRARTSMARPAVDPPTVVDPPVVP
ncbi:hypothetical protein DZF91_11385 [Actinomadura logoneensis]|uniref:Uncharacterized protein n=1 Tax=Actinomadura logoneensis TaxID=2293572 RepID=A0A372JNB0_9ACTN|nr:hypothetical protein [Actinomadura logoneensis]RFU41521.1 hypothetical protein DZF91_11385 [Actinomadura logoneensis]